MLGAGHIALPGLMTDAAVAKALEVAARVQAIHEEFTARITPLREAHERRVEAATTDAEREALEDERWKPGADGDFNLVLNPGSNCAEVDPWFEGVLGHPDMRRIVDRVLGTDARFDHCAMANRHGGDGGIGWHSHGTPDRDATYEDGRGFIRVFFYINGFELSNGNLKVIP